MSPPFDNCIFCNKSVNDASLPETGGYGVSLWISLCKILRVTPDESHWKAFQSCRLCLSCHSLAVQSSQVLKHIESLQIELEGLSARLKDTFRGTILLNENTNEGAMESGPIVTLRTFLRKSLRHQLIADDIIQVMPVWKEEFDHDDDGCPLDIEDSAEASNDGHDRSSTALEPDVGASPSSNPVEVREGVEASIKRGSLKNVRTFVVQGHVLKELEIRLERLPPNNSTVNANRCCGPGGSISGGGVGSTNHEDNECGSSWEGESSSEATSEDESEREERNPPATVRRKRHDYSQERLDDDKYQCQVCMKVFKSRLNLWMHKKLHEGKNHACEICNSSFKTKAQLSQHKKRRHLKDKICNLCGKAFAFNCELKQHERTHHEVGKDGADHTEHSDQVSHTCEFCGSVLSTRRKLLHHVRYHHKEKKHVCETCGKKFYEVVELKRHIFTHSKDKPFTCELCGKAVTVLRVHKIHCLERRNSDEKNFSCSKCNKTFHLEVSLKRHEYIHLNPDRFECDVCKKKFRLNCFLVRHRRSHFLEECIPCSMCSARFKRPQDLKWHMEYDHLGNRDKCSVCGYEATSRALFKVHERKHELGNRFSCDLCGKKFFTSAHMRRHIRTHEKKTRKS